MRNLNSDDRPLCPNGCGENLVLGRKTSKMVFRGVEMAIQEELFQCPVCGLESGTIEQAAAIQDAIRKAYLAATGEKI